MATNDPLFEAVHHPTEGPAVEIDRLVHAVAVEGLLLHKRPTWGTHDKPVVPRQPR
jgi:hypothetical protein